MRTHPLLAVVPALVIWSILGAHGAAGASTLASPRAIVATARGANHLVEHTRGHDRNRAKAGRTHRAAQRRSARRRSAAAARAHPLVVHPYTALDGVWASLRQCESGGNYAEDVGNGYYGAYQFSLSTWLAIGRSGLPSAASPQAQDAAAVALLHSQGWRAWPTCSWKIGV